MHRPGRNTGGAPVKKSIAIVVTVRAPLARILCDPDRDLAERAGLLADTLDGRGWFVGDVTRRGYIPVSVNALVPEGAAIWLTQATPRQRRDLIRRLWAYDVPLFISASPAPVGAPPVAVVGVPIEKVWAAQDAAAAIEAEQEHRVTLVRREQLANVGG